jgi:hypothetical protein
LGTYDYNDHNRSRSIRRKISEITPDRWVELIIALAVVIFAALQYRSSQSTSEQTNQLIAAAKVSAYAAKDNVQASRNFAESARGINRGISDAVDKLNLQAGALTDSSIQARILAKQTQRLAEDTEHGLRVTERAYIGFVTIKGISPGGGPFYPDVVFSNVGKTAATHVRAHVFGNEGALPKEMAIMDHPLGDDGSVADEIPNIPFVLGADNTEHPPMDAFTRNELLTRRQITVYGRIDYEDTFGISHWLTFCRHFLEGSQWEACGPKYNQSDKNPE